MRVVVAVIPVAQPRREVQAETTVPRVEVPAAMVPDPPAQVSDHRVEAHPVDHPAVMVDHRGHPMAMDQPSMLSPHPCAALAIKDHLDPQDPKAPPATPARMVEMAKTVTTARTPNCWLPSPPKFALSAHQDLRDHPDPLARKDLQAPKAALANRPRMECPESKAWADNPANKADQAAKDLVALPASPVVLSQFPDLRAPADHLELQENPAPRDNPAQTDNPSKALLDCPATQARLAAKVDPDRLDQLVLPETRARRAHASTALRPEPRQAIKPPDGPLLLAMALHIPILYLHIFDPHFITKSP